MSAPRTITEAKSYESQLDVGTSTFFYLAFTGWDNKEHMVTIGKVWTTQIHQSKLSVIRQVLTKADPNLNYVTPKLQHWKPGMPLAVSALPPTPSGRIRVRFALGSCAFL